MRDDCRQRPEAEPDDPESLAIKVYNKLDLALDQIERWRRRVRKTVRTRKIPFSDKPLSGTQFMWRDAAKLCRIGAQIP